jgi:hypothetical protein
MAGLDVGFLTADPLLSDLFDVKRRAETVGSDGRVAMTTTLLPKKRGVVCAADPADLIRKDDGEYAPRVIEVNTQFRLRGASTGYQPDIIVWKGVEYMVEKVLPFSNFGSGHTRVLAASIAATDPPTD